MSKGAEEDDDETMCNTSLHTFPLFQRKSMAEVENAMLLVTQKLYASTHVRYVFSIEGKVLP